MNKINRIMLMFVGLNGAIATIVAAMASHSTVMANNPYLTGVFNKANTLHYYHLLALMAVIVLYHLTKVRVWLWSAGSFALGIILFSGSLYLFAFSGAKIAGFLTPLGGGCFILGWGILMLAGFLSRKELSKERPNKEDTSREN